MARSVLWLGLATTLGCQQQPQLPAAYSGPEAAPAASEIAFDFAAQWRRAELYQSGKRLRARLLEGAPDAVAFAGFWDQQLSANCAPDLAADNVMRCLPAAAGGTVYYLDADCSEAVWESSGAGAVCDAPAAAFARAPMPAMGECAEASLTQIYQIGAGKSPANVFTLGADGCQPAEAVSCLHELVPLAPENFVAAHSELEQVDDGLSIRWLVYDDGARKAVTLHDDTRGTDCEVDPSISGERCVSSNQAQIFLDAPGSGGGVYTDSACTDDSVVWAVSRKPCTPAAVGVRWNFRGCEEYQPELFEIGAKLTHLYAPAETTCTEYAVGPDIWAYSLAAPLNMEELPLALSLHGGHQRLQLKYTATTWGKPIRDSQSFFDSVLQRDCAPVRLADFSERCVPQGRTPELAPAGPFADAQCTHGLVTQDIPAADSCSPAAPTLAVQFTAERDYPQAYYQVGERFDPDNGLVYYAQHGICLPRGVSNELAYYEVGEPVSLALMSERIE